MAGKAIGTKRGMAMLKSVAGNNVEIDYSMPHGILWSGLDNSIVEKYKQEQAFVFDDKDNVCDHIVGSTIGTDIGPGVIGVAFFEK